MPTMRLGFTLAAALLLAAQPVPAQEVERISTLLEGGARVDWLGNQIAFDALDANQEFFAVYVMDADGQNVRCVTCGHPDLPGRHTGQPAWHPSGRYLVFQAEKREHIEVRFESTLWPGAGVLNDLWLLDFQTGRATILREVENAPGRGTLHAHFSADGTLLSWSEMQAPGALELGKQFGVWALRTAEFKIDGPIPRLENVSDPLTPGGDGFFYENHGFSPDGSRLLFSSNFEAQAWLENHIYTYELKPKLLKRLTFEGYNEHAQYSPDGSYIVWMSNKDIWGPGTDYWIMEADGSNERRLTFLNKRRHPHYAGEDVVVSDFSWRGDSRAFAAYSNKPGAFASKTRPTRILLIELRR